jgi:two-component system C4-dicarboxylate transport response regulator DctD
MHDDLTVLLVDDDEAVRFACAQALRLQGLKVEPHESGESARARLRAGFPGIVVTDVRMPGMSGLELMSAALAIDDKLPVILVTGHGDVAMAVQAMRGGAYDFIEKPLSTADLHRAVLRALEKRALTLEVDSLRKRFEVERDISSRLIGRSPQMEALRQTILHIADAAPDVLIIGETGSGKEMVGRCLHDFSSRNKGRFVAVNCGAIPESLFESEMFGHESGAFTGAVKQRIGRLEHAAGGTLFLDEIESMPLNLQVKFLRALQERQIERLGSNDVVPVELRVIATTKDDLLLAARDHKFRSDLYYRLSIVVLEIPPLRERREDIALLFEHFILHAAEHYRRPAPLVPDALMRRLTAYDWPGNVRELRNVADRFVLGVLAAPFLSEAPAPVADTSQSLGDLVSDFERQVIVDALSRHEQNVAAAGAALGLPRKTLYDKMRRYGLSRRSLEAELGTSTD